MARYRHHNDGAEAMAGGLMGIAIVLLIILAFLIVRLTKKVIEAFTYQPKSPALLIPLFGIAMATLVALVTRGDLQTMAISMGLFCLVVLVISAIGICMHHDPFMHEAGPTVAKALRRQWWADSNAVQQAA